MSKMYVCMREYTVRGESVGRPFGKMTLRHNIIPNNFLFMNTYFVVRARRRRESCVIFNQKFRAMWRYAKPGISKCDTPWRGRARRRARAVTLVRSVTPCFAPVHHLY